MDWFCRDYLKKKSPACPPASRPIAGPATVRELQTRIERAVILADGMPTSSSPQPVLHRRPWFVEAPNPLVEVDLTGTLGHVTRPSRGGSRAAEDARCCVKPTAAARLKLLQISYKNLLAKLKEHAIE